MLLPLISPFSTSATQYWHLSSFAYAAISYPFDSVTSRAKFTAGTKTNFYELGQTSRRYTIFGLVFSGIFSTSCIIAGTVIIATRGYCGAITYPTSLQRETLALVLNLIVTVCTESTGFAHSMSLRSALASEYRLRFNANLRLLTAARGWTSPNGILLNGVMAILLILSYASSSFAISSIMFVDNSGTATYGYVIVGLPLLLLGVALLLQVVIASLGIWAVKILTWSSSPFDVTIALIHHIQLTPVPLRCMRGVSDVDVHGYPTKPFKVQPSAWHAHPSIRKVTMSLWGLVVACALWAAFVILIWYEIWRKDEPSTYPWKLWSFFPTDSSPVIWRDSQLSEGNATIQWWIVYISIVALLQGPLTLALHCSELIAIVIRDERYWRRATRRTGLKMETTTLNLFLTDPFSLILFVAKPALHWMFGLSFNLLDIGSPGNNVISMIRMTMYPAQIVNLCIAQFSLACFFTVIALYRPSGPQPAAYGHLQTLANLIDEWSPVMWWGHKEDGFLYCHAGTSCHRLQAVKMNCVYAGPSSMSHSPDLSWGHDLQAYTSPGP